MIEPGGSNTPKFALVYNQHLHHKAHNKAQFERQVARKNHSYLCQMQNQKTQILKCTTVIIQH